MTDAPKFCNPNSVPAPCPGARSSVFCATSRDPILCEHQATEADNCYFGSDCRCAAPSAAANDASLGAWLWQWSAAAVALPEQNNLARQ